MPAAVRLHSDAIELEVLPAQGERITALRDRRSGRDALWSSPTHAHREHAPGTTFDDVFAGGWDELIPNDEPSGELPDHGELWTARLDVVERAEGHTALTGALPISGLTVDKRVSVAADEVDVELRIVNEGTETVGVAVKLHPALNIATGARVLAPRGPAHVPDVALSRAAADFEWPEAIGHDGARVRTDIVPGPGPAVDWLLLPGAGRRGDGRFGLVHEGEDWAVTMAVDGGVLPALWLFADYGGWKGCRFLILEPATDGTRLLAPGQALECAVRCRLGRAALAQGILGAA